MTLYLFWNFLPNKESTSSPYQKCLLPFWASLSLCLSLQPHFLYVLVIIFLPSLILANSKFNLTIYLKCLVFSEGFTQCPKQRGGFLIESLHKNCNCVFIVICLSHI